MRFRAIAAASVLLFAPGGLALAQPSEERSAARDLIRQAEEKAAAGQLDEAQALFERADALVPAPTLKMAVVRLLTRRGLLVEAQVLAADVARSQPAPTEPPSWARARAEAQQEARSLEVRLAILDLQIAGLPEGVTPAVSLSGQPLPAAAVGVPRVLNPGSYTIEINAPGFRPAEGNVTLAEGQRQKISVRMQPLEKRAEKSSSGRSVTAVTPLLITPVAMERRANQALLWGGIAVAAGFGALGGAASYFAHQKREDLGEQCPNDACADAADRRDQIKRLEQAAIGSWLVAGGGVVLSVAGVIVGEEAPVSAMQPRLRVGLGQASVAWRF